MKTTSALALAAMLAISGAAFAQTGGGSAGGGSAGGGSAGGASAGGAASGGAAGTTSGAATSGTGAATGGPVGSIPGTSTSGPRMGAGVGGGTAATNGTNAPATGGAPTSPGGLNNQLQSNQNQQVGTGANRSGAVNTPSNLATGNPALSGSGRDANARARNAQQCDAILNDRAGHSADQVAACEKSSAANDPAAALDRRLQTENSRAVNSICRGC